MRRLNRSVAALASALLLIGSACGGGGDESAPEPANAGAEPGGRDVTRFLLRAGEHPGFRPDGEAMTVTGADAVARQWGLPQAEARRLRERGLVSFTTRRTAGRDAGGVSDVLLFRTARGARDQMAYDLRASTIRATLPDTEIRRFSVGDVPGARGWTGSDLHGNPIGTVAWVQGRCMLMLVSEGDLRFVEALSAGARAIHRRTGGDCP